MTHRKLPFGHGRGAPYQPQSPFEKAAESLFDKTAGAAKLITETEARQRADRSEALRTARLARDDYAARHRGSWQEDAAWPLPEATAVWPEKG